MAVLKLIAIGNSIGMILPKELLVQLGVQKGDTLIATAEADGFKLSARAPDMEEQMVVARRIMRERVAVLRELAK